MIELMRRRSCVVVPHHSIFVRKSLARHTELVAVIQPNSFDDDDGGGDGDDCVDDDDDDDDDVVLQQERQQLLQIFLQAMPMVNDV